MTQQQIDAIQQTLTDMRAKIDEIESQLPRENAAAVLARQKAAWKRLRDEIAALPPEGTADSFSGADHDRILYGANP